MIHGSSSTSCNHGRCDHWQVEPFGHSVLVASYPVAAEATSPQLSALNYYMLSFDILGVFDFTSNFMLLYILEESETLAEWGRNLGDASRPLVEDPNDTLLCNWMSVLPRLQPYLSPFEILSVFMNGVKYQ